MSGQQEGPVKSILPVYIAETVPRPVPTALPLDHPVCAQDGKLALSLHPFITWTPGALKQARHRCGDDSPHLYLGRGLQGTQGTLLHTGLLEGLPQGLSPLGRKGHAFI